MSALINQLKVGARFAGYSQVTEWRGLAPTSSLDSVMGLDLTLDTRAAHTYRA